MILSALVIIIVIACAVVWGSKGRGYGLFSAMLALVCTIAAGAIAFALWEVVGQKFATMAGGMSGMLGALLENAGWGLGLLLPFAVSLLVLRLLTDTLVKANLQFSDAANQIGGIIFGAGVGIIISGVLVLSLGYMNLPPKLLGYNPIEDERGNLIFKSKLLLPADVLTVKLYEHLSMGAFANATPLATYRPAAYVEAAMQRKTYRGAARAAVAPKDFEVLGVYTVTGSRKELVSDSFLGGAQQILNWNGTSAGEGSAVYGYAIKMSSGVKERGGNVVVTPGQVRLLVKLGGGSSLTLQPFAVIAPPDPSSDLPLYRFRFDATDAFIASGGGGSSATFAFEFLVPKGATPLSLFFKNVRTDVSGKSKVAKTPAEFTTRSARDEAIRSDSLFSRLGGAVAAGPLDTSRSRKVSPLRGSQFEDLIVSANLPSGMIINKTNKGGLQVDSKNNIVGGSHKLLGSMTRERGLDRKLAIGGFALTKTTRVVQITMSTDGALSAFGKAIEGVDANGTPSLIDDKGRRYDALGFIYKEGDTVRIRFEPGRPLAKLADAPMLSRTKRDQTLVLIFRPTRGVTITGLAIGNIEVVHFASPGIHLSSGR